MVKLWIKQLQQNFKCRMCLKYPMHKPSIYTIWYIECNSIFDKIATRKYPWKCFQWYHLPERHINWNKGQIFITLVLPLKLPIAVSSRTFLYQMITQETNLRKKCWVMSFTDRCDLSDDVIPGHVKIGTCDMLSVTPCVRFILNRRLHLKSIKEHQMIVFCHMVVRSQYLVQYSDPVQYPHKKAIQSLVATSP